MSLSLVKLVRQWVLLFLFKILGFWPFFTWGGTRELLMRHLTCRNCRNHTQHWSTISSVLPLEGFPGDVLEDR